MKLPDEETLAEEFRIVMNEQLGPRTRAKIDRLNALEPNSGVCHSHDFIDANMVMAEALGRFNVEVNPTDDAQLSLMTRAWTIAKAAGFSK